jgi:glyoxylase-like metal-dependent hydrolase (beta-lactamase superfamily II)
MLSENCYVVSDESRDCVIIDCGAYYPEEGQAIVGYIRQQQLTPRHLLCTHGHFDHCIGNGYIFRAFGLKPRAHQDDSFLMAEMERQTSDILGIPIHLDVPPVGNYLTDSDNISFGSHTWPILHTPGHTPGGIVLYDADEDIAFSGDTLFRMSIGRTDFEPGSYADMMTSLHMLATQLPADTKIYAGHGPETTMADEIRYNPYLR